MSKTTQKSPTKQNKKTTTSTSPKKKTTQQTSSKATTNKKQSKSGTKKKKSSQNDHHVLSMEMKLLLLLVMCLFMILSLHTSSVGFVGTTIRTWLTGLFSLTAYALPYALLTFFITNYVPRLAPHKLRMRISATALFLALTLFVGLNSRGYLLDDIFEASAIKLTYDNGTVLLGSGVIGQMIFKLIYTPLGLVGTWLVFFALILVFLAFAVYLTPSRIMKGIGKSALMTKDAVVKTNQNVGEAVKLGYEQLKQDYDDKAHEREKNRQHIIQLMNKDLFKEEGDEDFTPNLSRPRSSDSTESQPSQPKDQVTLLVDHESNQDYKEDKGAYEPDVIDVSDSIKILDFQTMSKKKRPQVVPESETLLNNQTSDKTPGDGSTPPAPEPAKMTSSDLKAIKKENANISQEEQAAVEHEIKEAVKLAFENYQLPHVGLLNEGQVSNGDRDRKDILVKARLLEDTLKNFKIDAKVVQVSKGPMITRFEIQPSPGVKVSKIVNLQDDIALNLAATNVRIVAPIPGKAAVGIEVPNKNTSIVTLRDVVESDPYESHGSHLRFGLGKDISGMPIVADLAKMPHLLIAGATGSGKSVCVNTIITSILYNAKPDEVKFLMIDPKVVELNVYNGIPHLILPVVTDPKKASIALNWAVQEMTERYNKFAEAGVRDVTSYNKKYELKGEGEFMPRIVVIIDELADLMMVAPNQVEDAICRLAQMARAAGIHLIVATQRPSVDVITGVIKANIPSRIAFAVSSQIDSRTIIDMGGAEKLLGKGDMLYFPVGEAKPKRVQGAFISEHEVEQVITHIKGQLDQDFVYDEAVLDQVSEALSPSQDDQNGDDELIYDVIQFVVEAEKASTSLLQRRFRIGYGRAARIIDELETRGVVGPSRGSKPREVLMSKSEYEMSGE